MAQPGGNPYTARIAVLQGNDVEFTFNSYKRIQDGVKHTYWTKLGIAYNNPDDATDGWRLSIHANAANLTGEEANTIPVDVLRVEAFNGAYAPYNSAVISPLPQVLVPSGPQGTESANIVYLSYECGTINTPTKMNTQTKDVYTVELILTLESD